MAVTLVWFRHDLRLNDHPALSRALARGGAILPVFILDRAVMAPGGAAAWWLHHSLASLDASLRTLGSRLLLREGDSTEVLAKLVREAGADAVCWNRRYELEGARQDAAVAEVLQRSGTTTFAETGGLLLFEPETVRNRAGDPFQVFGPFWRTCLARTVAAPAKLRSAALPAPAQWPPSSPLASLGLLPNRGWAREFPEHWEPGEPAARRKLLQFARQPIATYAETRDRPAISGTSRLSPHLHFGELSPRQVWAAVHHAGGRTPEPLSRGAAVFLSELGWREFAHHLLLHFPDTPRRPLRPAFAKFPWADDPGGERWRAWTRGRTGYPIVDAGMRELWRTGWMHNRVRMIVASFLVKHLRLPWTRGAEWFADTLVDADVANNTLNWQWSAGCGADAAPYFRIFAPVLQGRKFDPDGTYVRRWVPELAGVPARHVHAPWEASPAELIAAGVRLGETYPRPIVDHATARAEALAAFKKLSSLTA